MSGNGKIYWRSLDELADTPDFRKFVEQEFPNLVPDLLQSPSRRRFLKLMGASLALAGLTGCRWPKENLVPASRQPPGRIPGKPVQYATTMELNGVSTGLLVTCYDGRPVKIEGNDLHPFSQGATDALMQASILEMYDPDRSRQPLRRISRATGSNANAAAQPEASEQNSATWQDFEKFATTHFAAFKQNQGAGLYVLSEASAAPSFVDLRDRFLKAFPQAQWCEYEPLSRDNERAGLAQAFGKPYRAQLSLEKADIVVSLDDDFLLAHPAAVRYTRDYAKQRRAENGTMSRIYVVESALSLTGGMADHRYPVRSADVALVAGQLAAALIKKGLELPAAGLKEASDKYAGHAFKGVSATALEGIAKDLLEHKGKCVLTAGPNQPAEVHALVAVLNTALGNVGQTVQYFTDPNPQRPAHGEAMVALAEKLRNNAVDTLVILGGNPAYNAPADLDFATALSKAKTSIHLSLFDDETSQLCQWHLPRAHYLESWGDGCAYDGTVSLLQPLIEPLFGGRTVVELLALLCGDELTQGYDIVRRTLKARVAGAGDFEAAWRKMLNDGVVPQSGWKTETPAATAAALGAGLDKLLQSWTAPAAGKYELVFRQDYSVYDGRFANNGWLQEMPDPISKLTWDNAAYVSPKTAQLLGIQKNGDLLTLKHAARPALTMAAFIVPGIADGSVTVPLGYGRKHGVVGYGAGFDTYALRTSKAMNFVGGADVTRTGEWHKLAYTQDHHTIASHVGDHEKAHRVPELVREGTLGEYKHEPDFAKKVVHLPLLSNSWTKPYDPIEYNGHKWGMAIDLTACTGCSACVIACQAENNIPVVGKDEVERGREMHWIRIDRYYTGTPDQAETVEVACQPLPCQHCENAPCEQVCPVGATMHDEDGVNVMVYNRCVGTRYCNNNCPYKVRRFNWFWNHHGPFHPRSGHQGVVIQMGKTLTDVEKMAHNPDVTMRSRGVMEKCTYCIQRINAVKITARNDKRRILDGEITPACAQACPAEAIVFGDLNDTGSRVRKLHDHNRSYALLAELNVRPRTQYLAKLRNPAGGATTQPAHGGGHAAVQEKLEMANS